jgi:hypothetical protein
MENWKDILGYEMLYEVSSNGNIRNKKTSKILSNKSNSYVTVSLFKNKICKRFTAHRIVAEAFIKNPLNKKEVNHINGIKNDNRIENLEWCTSSENINHSWRIGTSKMTDKKRKIAREKGKMNKENMFITIPVLDKLNGIVYKSRKELAKEMNITVSAVCYRIKKGIYKSLL